MQPSGRKNPPAASSVQRYRYSTWRIRPRGTDAIRNVWANVWNLRAFEERSFRGIDHRSVDMALLVHNSFPDEEANRDAITANSFDPSGLEPGFYINIQVGEESVVAPDPGITTDQFIYQFAVPGQHIIFIATPISCPGDVGLDQHPDSHVGNRT